MTRELLKQLSQDLRQGHPPGRNPQEDQIAAVIQALQHLGGQTVQGSSELNRGQNFNAIDGHGSQRRARW